GEARVPVEETQALTGLESSTFYHYRITATNSGGTSYGLDKTFSTALRPKWLLNGKEAIGAIKAEGTLTLKDTGLEVTAECGINETGWVWGKEASIEKITGFKGESSITCHPIEAGWCGTSAIEVSAVNLSWSTELVDVPVENSKHEVHYEYRLLYRGTNQPGLTVKCAFMGSTATDNCLGESTSHVENITGGVATNFESKSPALTCTGSALGTGSIEGTLTFKSTEEGKTLSVYGAPGP
ncbi:MAG: hypothetical protein ACRDK4_14735, partial [Solirubrobacteraceae bacterium]